MPNIEAYGLNAAEMQRLRARIEALFVDAPYHKELITTWFPGSLPIDSDDNPQPYLRIQMTYDIDMRDDILRRLNPLCMDIEVASFLQKFIPRPTNTS